MKIFVIGDLHLSNHMEVDKPMDIFGIEWLDHTARLKNNWNEIIGDDDYVLIAGDISWGLTLNEAKADLDWINGLKGKKLLFKGNHDPWWQSTNKLNLIYKDESLTFMQNHAFIIEKDGEKIGITGTRGWICPGTEGFGEHDRKVYNREVLRLEMSLKEAKQMGADRIITIFHFPPTNDKHQQSGFTELLEKYNVEKAFYGHLHGKDVWPKGLKGVLNGISYDLVSLDYLKGIPKEIV